MSNEKASNAIVSTVTFYASALAEVTARAVDAEKRAAAAIEQVNALQVQFGKQRTSDDIAELLRAIGRWDAHVWNELASAAAPYTLSRLVELRRAWDGDKEYGKVESEKHASR